jgi:hypothetical protein
MGDRISSSSRPNRSNHSQLLAKPGCGEAGVHVFVELVVGFDVLSLAAFPLEPFGLLLALQVVGADVHADGGANTREGVGHEPEEGSAAQAPERVGRDARPRRSRSLELRPSCRRSAA